MAKQTPPIEQARPDELKKSSLYSITLVICLAIIAFAVLVSRKRASDAMSEAERLELLKAARGEQDTVAMRGASEFPPELVDPSFAVVFARLTRNYQGPIGYCTDLWRGAPGEALIRITTDAVGGLSSLAVQGAPEPVTDCLIKVLSKAPFPWDTDAVTTLRIDAAGASIEEIGGVTEPAPDLSEKPKAPSKDWLPQKPGEFTGYQGGD